jgi:hypothetical protein
VENPEDAKGGLRPVLLQVAGVLAVGAVAALALVWLTSRGGDGEPEPEPDARLVDAFGASSVTPAPPDTVNLLIVVDDEKQAAALFMPAWIGILGRGRLVTAKVVVVKSDAEWEALLDEVAAHPVTPARELVDLRGRWN